MKRLLLSLLLSIFLAAMAQDEVLGECNVTVQLQEVSGLGNGATDEAGTVGDAISLEPSMLVHEDKEACSFRQHEEEHLENLGVRIYVVDCYIHDEHIGSLTYMNLPIFNSTYVLMSFYINPEYRNKGYGNALLKYTCDYLRYLGATSIYIQPGPFELGRAPEGYLTAIKPTGELYTAKVEQLVAFYKKHQFVPASALLISAIGVFYKCMEIDEDVHYLMVKKIA